MKVILFSETFLGGRVMASYESGYYHCRNMVKSKKRLMLKHDKKQEDS